MYTCRQIRFEIGEFVASFLLDGALGDSCFAIPEGKTGVNGNWMKARRQGMMPSAWTLDGCSQAVLPRGATYKGNTG